MNDRLLTALLDTLLPGDDRDWPAAGTHGLGQRTCEIAAMTPGGAAALETILAALPTDFPVRDEDSRAALLGELEAQSPDAFSRVVTAAYSAYYTDPAIRAVVERVTGYPDRPPQPRGYDLEPFDESLLDQVKARGPIWRHVPVS